VYCGGLKITNSATVTLAPGIYIVQGGKLTVDRGASLEGEDVGKDVVDGPREDLRDGMHLGANL